MRKVKSIIMLALFLMVSSVVLEPNVTYAAAQTAEQKQARKDEKNLNSLKEGIDKIQKLLDENNAKHAKNAVKSAERNYTKLSSETQGTAEVVALKTKLDELAATVTEQLDSAKTAKKDVKNIQSVEKYMERIKPYLEENNIASARRSVDDANRIFVKISEAGQQQENVVAMKIRLDELTQLVEESEVAAEEHRELVDAMIRQESEYRSFIESHRVNTSWLNMINHGKRLDPDDNYSLSELEGFEKDFEALADAEADFRAKFKLLIEQAPDHVSNGFTVTDVLGLLGNRFKYRDALVESVCQKYLDKNLENMGEVYSTLESNGYIYAHWLDDLYGSKAKEPLDCVKNVVPHYAWIGKKAPQDKLDALAAYKPNLRTLLETKAKGNKWDKSKYTYDNGPMKKQAEALGKRYKMDLKKVAMTSKDEWHINKNSLGVPLNRRGEGFVLYQKDGEPFKRGYEIRFYSQFNGTGYEPISEASLDHYVYPFK